ncbi:hypothetical protein L7F22_011957 [Adiantum nelumboides]|nr:hypothetical protein [Adiantum nelumboides]
MIICTFGGEPFESWKLNVDFGKNVGQLVHSGLLCILLQQLKWGRVTDLVRKAVTNWLLQTTGEVVEVEVEDSYLVTNRWRVRSCKMQAMWSQVREYLHNLPSFHIFLEPRNLNQHAMRLAREAIGGIRSGDALRSKIDNKQPCAICLESKYQAEMVKISGCSHEFCNKCLVQHAEVKVQSGQVPVGCPHVGCTTILSLDDCQSLMSQRWYDLLQKRLMESSIPEAERVYCPYSYCSALMDRRNFNVNTVTSAASSSTASACKKCLECARLFCMECRVPWHVSMTCDYYQSLPPQFQDKQDAQLHQLAANQRWQRCKKCRRMIELSEGCYHMTCRCGYEFCYVCGKEWKGKDGTCDCQLWDEHYLLEPRAQAANNDRFHRQADEGETDSYDEVDFDEVDGRSNFLFVSNPTNPLYKTRLCRHWSSGLCVAGLQCNFAHGAHELR